MKKIIIFLILSLLFFYTGCTGKKETPEKDDTISTEQSVKDDSKNEEPKAEKEDREPEKLTENEEIPEKEEKKEEATSSSEEPEKPSTESISSPGEPDPGEEGIISLIDGDIDVVRDGESLADDVEEGFGIQNYDVISTGENSLTEIEVISDRCPDTLLIVNENTIFSFEINKIDNTDTTSFDILNGSLTLKVEALTTDQDLEVTTGEVSMGVRGTTFSVSTLPTGDALVTCSEGLVECSDDSGRKYVAKPGKVVLKSAGAALKEVSVLAKNVAKYREEWLNEKTGLLEATALIQIKKYVEEYESRIDEFNEAYNNLMNEKVVIEKWIEEDKKGKTGTLAEIITEKKKIIGHIFKIQAVLFWFEHIYYRLMQLKSYHDRGYGKGEIRAGFSTTDFFNTFVKTDIKSKLGSLKYIYKLYSKRNDGSVPIQKTPGNLMDMLQN